ncbi:AAA-like domain-containing protein [Prochlorothrix hollandica]|uniref:AAA-like domain-containing protein n=1 Tax=Prochlorothrix hollandica TaxID=1223 RepID=UPI003340E4CF
MAVDSPFYVERSGDDQALAVIRRLGVTLYIDGERQVGKSSLLMRVLAAAETSGKRTVTVDCQGLSQNILGDEDRFYRWFCVQLAQELDLEDDLDRHWERYRKGGNSSCCTQYLKHQILAQVSEPVVIALDEVEMLIDAPFKSQFFGMLRSWHNRRAHDQPMKRVDLVLISSTEPHQLIENLNQSPFNVGEKIKMEDFTPGQVADLNQRHGSPFDAAHLEQLATLLGGHPFLVRQALYWVASGRQTAAELLAMATREQGAFGEHLRHLRLRLDRRPELQLAEGMKLIVNGSGHRVPKAVAVRLEAAGLVRAETKTAEPRCELYRLYFRESLG